MQINKLNQNLNNNKTTQNNYSSPAFSSAGRIINGTLSVLDTGIRWIENGGFATEFTTVDLCGMIGPRTFQAYMRNRKELGHLNRKAGTEEAIREILTGPSMFLIPVTFLALSGKIFGRGSKLSVKNLNEFKKITEKALKSSKDKPLTKAFLTEVVDSVYKSKISKKTVKIPGSQTEILKEFINNTDVTNDKKILLNQLNILYKKSNKLFSGKYKSKELKKQIKKLKESITKHVVNTNQSVGNFEELGITLADPANIKLGKNNINVSDFIADTINYSTDVIKKLSTTKDTNKLNILNNIHKFKVGARKLITTTAVVTTSAFLYCIPMIYKKNKSFPGIEGLENPVNKENKEAGK